jgi:hypothetical protein
MRGLTITGSSFVAGGDGAGSRDGATGVGTRRGSGLSATDRAAGFARGSCETAMRVKRVARPGIASRLSPGVAVGRAKCFNAPPSPGAPRCIRGRFAGIAGTTGSGARGAAALSGSPVKSTHWMSRHRSSPRSARTDPPTFACRLRSGARPGRLVESGMTVGGFRLGACIQVLAHTGCKPPHIGAENDPATQIPMVTNTSETIFRDNQVNYSARSLRRCRCGES